MKLFQSKPLVYIRALRCLSIKDRFKVMYASFKRSKYVWPIPDTLVQMDTFKFVIGNGGTVQKTGAGDRITFIDPYAATDQPLKIQLRPSSSDFLIFNEVFKSHGYYDIFKLLEKSRNEALNIIDAGANIGCTSLWLAQIFSNATIVAIEADANNYKCLSDNITLNNYEHRIHALHNAFWYNEDELKLSTGFRDGREYAFSVLPELEGQYAVVKGVTINNLMDRFNFKQVDVLKIDIEGAEKYLFKDLKVARDLLNKVKMVAIEIHEDIVDKNHILNCFSELGYKYYQITDTTYAFKA